MSILGLVLFVFVLVFIAGRYILPDIFGQSDQADTTIQTGGKLLGQKMPAFDIPDAAGKRVSSSAFLDRPLVLVFWATWNQPSADEIKILDDYLASGDSRAGLVSFLAIDSQEDASVALSFIRRSGYTVPFGLDSYGDVTDHFQIKSLPTVYFIDRDGIIREIDAGVLNRSMFVDKIEQLLK